MFDQGRAMSEEFRAYGKQRREPRHNVDFRVLVLFSKDGSTETNNGHGSDLSEGGISVYASTELQEGMHVQLELTLPYSRRVLRIEAVVRNREGYRYGLQFLTLSSSQRQEIARFCQTAAVMNSVQADATATRPT